MTHIDSLVTTRPSTRLHAQVHVRVLAIVRHRVPHTHLVGPPRRPPASCSTPATTAPASCPRVSLADDRRLHKTGMITAATKLTTTNTRSHPIVGRPRADRPVAAGGPSPPSARATVTKTAAALQPAGAAALPAVLRRVADGTRLGSPRRRHTSRVPYRPGSTQLATGLSVGSSSSSSIISSDDGRRRRLGRRRRIARVQVAGRLQC